MPLRFYPRLAHPRPAREREQGGLSLSIAHRGAWYTIGPPPLGPRRGNRKLLQK
jgi:hypothetical protein